MMVESLEKLGFVKEDDEFDKKIYFDKDIDSDFTLRVEYDLISHEYFL